MCSHRHAPRSAGERRFRVGLVAVRGEGGNKILETRSFVKGHLDEIGSTGGF